MTPSCRVSNVLVAANLSLLILFPIAWWAPLARAGLLPFFGLKEMSILSAISVLLEEDWVLAGLVIFLALIAPLGKAIALAAIHYGRLTKRSLPILDIVGKLAMADVFLIAVYIVVAKGVGVGRIETAWGLYLFTACVALSMVATYATKRALSSTEGQTG